MTRATIAYLERRYPTLEREIADVSHLMPDEDVLIADLKFRKLVIADEIRHNRRIVEHFATAI